jgi:Vam6/Vps39-like protein vacuolar protein sorting-associated protein 39
LRGFLAVARAQLQKYINYEGRLKNPIPTPSSSQTSEAREAALTPPFAHFILDAPTHPTDSMTSTQTSIYSEHEWEEKLHNVAKMVDTALFRTYMLVSPTLAGPLFRLDNFCDPEVVTVKLYDTGRYIDLIDFLHGKKLHRDALEVLQRFGKDEADHEATPEALRGPQRTVGYLQQLPPEMIDLILEYAEWPLRTDAEVGMEVFLADTENAETLPRHKVLDFLSGIDKLLAVKYLEHIINEWNDGSPDFHQTLVDLYLDRLKNQGDMPGFKDDEEKEAWKIRLQDFLKSSSQYNRGKVFRQLPSDGMYRYPQFPSLH